jgi:hypothetical protein
MTTRDEYVATLKVQLDKWNAEIARWEAKTADAKEDVKKRYRAAIEKIGPQREKTLYNLKLLENATAAAWENLRVGVDDARERMQDAMKEARSHFERTKH